MMVIDAIEVEKSSIDTQEIDVKFSSKKEKAPEIVNSNTILLTTLALLLIDQKGIGPSGYTADRALGMTTQVPAVVELISHYKVTTNLDKAIISISPNSRFNDLGFFEIALVRSLSKPWDYSDLSWKTLIRNMKLLQKDSTVDLRKVRYAAELEKSPYLIKNLSKLERIFR